MKEKLLDTIIKIKENIYRQKEEISNKGYLITESIFSGCDKKYVTEAVKVLNKSGFNIRRQA